MINIEHAFTPWAEDISKRRYVLPEVTIIPLVATLSHVLKTTDVMTLVRELAGNQEVKHELLEHAEQKPMELQTDIEAMIPVDRLYAGLLCGIDKHLYDAATSIPVTDLTVLEFYYTLQIGRAAYNATDGLPLGFKLADRQLTVVPSPVEACRRLGYASCAHFLMQQSI